MLCLHSTFPGSELNVEKMFRWGAFLRIQEAKAYYPEWKMFVVGASTPLKFLSDFVLALGGIFSSTEFSLTSLPHDKLSE